jgi:serine O-acetyltransferase
LEQAHKMKKLPDQKNHIESILKSYDEIGGINHLDGENLPSRESVNNILIKLKEILFPGFFETTKLDAHNLPYITGQKITEIADALYEEILKSFCWECLETLKCTDKKKCEKKALKVVNELLNEIPAIRRELKEDAIAVLNGDPAAKCEAEIIMAYPGFQAISVYRVAHALYKKKVSLIPRLMSEIIHSETGIDIHPGATIGSRFCIDHGTGIVIGETSIIGNDVKLYQGVTIGALSVSKNIKGKRHPTIKDNTVVYSGTTILGGDTIIGKNCIIGGNVWLTKSVPDNSKIYISSDLKQVTKTD